MLEELYTFLKQAQNLSEKEAWLFAMDRDAKEEIIRLNTEDQLFDEGIDSMDRTLGAYSEVTKAIKRSKGQRTDHVTLKDTGEFYDSFKVRVDSKGFEIEADDTAFYDVPLTQTWGNDIIGLTKENIGFMAEWLKPGYVEYVFKKLHGV